MVQTKPISKTITSLLNLRERFNLTPTSNHQFSPEFTQDLPELTDSETAALDQIRNRFLRHRERGSLAEGTINHLVISPLLTLVETFRWNVSLLSRWNVSLLSRWNVSRWNASLNL
ncbi:MAG: hypothetical protein WBA89_15195 [Microcoleus sp.]|uniref:hypothetical protein n=1 Tax=Microcoleus sp. TaxID=44472 RepID=UPI003C74C935